MLRESVDKIDPDNDGFGYFEVDPTAEAARQKRESRSEQIITKIFDSAQTGNNLLSPAKFMTLCQFAYEPEAMPKEYRIAMKTGIVLWTNGIVFRREDGISD
jgi:hypothetical protein